MPKKLNNSIKNKPSQNTKPTQKPKPRNVIHSPATDEIFTIRTGLIIAALAAAGLYLNLDSNNQRNNSQTQKPKLVNSSNETKKLPEYSLKISKIHPITFQGKTDTNRLVELQKYWKDISLDAIKDFKDADPDVPKLIEYLEKNAYYTIPAGPKITQFFGEGPNDLEKLKNPKGFEIVFMPEIYANQMKSSIITESDGKVMRIASNFKIKQWLGIMLAHEMSHIYDLNVDGENPHNPDEYLAGEVRAHLLEMKLLKAWNPKTYALLLENGIQFYRTKKFDLLDQVIKSLYPVQEPLVSPKEAALGEASVLVALAFEEALQRGATKKDLGEVYQSITNFLSQ